MSFVRLKVNDDDAGAAIQILADQFCLMHVVDSSSQAPDAKEAARLKRTKANLVALGNMERKIASFEALLARYGVDAEVPGLADTDFRPLGTAPGAMHKSMGEEMKIFFRNRLDEQTVLNNIKMVEQSGRGLDWQLNQAEEHAAILRFADAHPGALVRERTGGAGYQSEDAQPDAADSKRGRRASDLEYGSSVGERAGLRVLWGTIPAYLKPAFRRVLFRASRGGNKTIPTFSDDEERFVDRSSGERVAKVAFSVVVIGRYLKVKIEELARYFQVELYAVERGTQARVRQAAALDERRRDLRAVLARTRAAIRRGLRLFAGAEFNADEPQRALRRIDPPRGGAAVPVSDDPSIIRFSPLGTWRRALAQQRVIERVKMQVEWGRLVTVTGWVPTTDYPRLGRLLRNASVQHYMEVDDDAAPGKLGPPTYFKTNAFTGQFQGIVDTYGVARYKEVNPGMFAIVTFPFLFGVMYGDIGHGTAMALLGAYMVYHGEANEALARRGRLGEMPGMLHSARFVLLLMGLFGLYCGTIYNDLFSVPLALFQGTWTREPGVVAAQSTGGVYPYGVDPAWYGTANQLAFFNSLKMKMSVTIGVSQMVFGIALSYLNHARNGDRVSIIFEWIPRMTFMCCTFGYMVAIIIYKWCVDWNADGIPAPSLIQTMIKMFLSPGNVPPDQQLYPGQALVQFVFIVAAVISVPVMLFVKPLIVSRRHAAAAARHGDDASAGDYEMANVASAAGGGDEERQPLVRSGGGGSGARVPSYETFGDVAAAGDAKRGVGVDAEGEAEIDEHSLMELMIHSGIHTIEFVLGCVSNTASYLRLWALSLAHAELSEVFWSKLVVAMGLETGSSIALVIAFAAWFCASFAVLICMDSMECVLHALRLTWVEWMNKFYNADGYKFQPVSYHDPEYMKAAL